jgi:hypothetical protein
VLLVLIVVTVAQERSTTERNMMSPVTKDIVFTAVVLGDILLDMFRLIFLLQKSYFILDSLAGR